MLGWSPRVNSWELLWQNFYTPDALPVTQLAASKHKRLTCTNYFDANKIFFVHVVQITSLQCKYYRFIVHNISAYVLLCNERNTTFAANFFDYIPTKYY